jgi:hypothetical protein
MMPKNSGGRPSHWRNHPRVTPSSSVLAGELFQTMALVFSTAESISPSTPGGVPELGK